MTDGIFSNPYIHVSGLSHTTLYFQQVEITGSCIMTHLLTALESHLNYDDCPVIYRTTIITAKVKVPTQHNSDSLLITIKTLLKHNQVRNRRAFPFLLSSQKDSNPIKLDWSFGEACLDNLSGHPLCKEEACLNSSCWTEALNGTTNKGSDSSWSHINIGVICGNKLRMSTPLRSRSSTMGSEGYFN